MERKAVVVWDVTASRELSLDEPEPVGTGNGLRTSTHATVRRRWHPLQNGIATRSDHLHGLSAAARTDLPGDLSAQSYSIELITDRHTQRSARGRRSIGLVKPAVDVVEHQAQI
jgi:hypothetical protein